MLISLPLILALCAPALAHGSDHDAAVAAPEQVNGTPSGVAPVPHYVSHMHGMPILQTDLLPIEKEYWENYNATNYFNYPTGDKTAMYFYFITFFVSFVFVYPIVLVFNNLHMDKVHLLGLCVHSILVLVGLFNYSIFINSVPDLYPNNVLTKFNWIYLFSTAATVVFAVLRYGYNYFGAGYSNLSDATDVDDFSSPAITLYDLSRNQSPSSFELDDHPGRAIDQEANVDSDLSRHLHTSLSAMRARGSSLLDRIVSAPVVKKPVDYLGAFSVTTFSLLNWFNFLFFLVYFPSALAVLGCIGQGETVFNLLAHFIKGGVFFSLGLLTLARYCGAFRNKGWAWNIKAIHNTSALNRWKKLQPKGLLTMEFVESFLILFYGSTNVFMEHLANPGGEWSVKDLQHASIAFIYIGLGLCGVLTEVKLNSWRFNHSTRILANAQKSILKASPGYSPNPFPIMTIFWTGYLMSKHEQASHLSTEIHTQWGSILVYGTIFRFFTYLYMMLVPRSDLAEVPMKPLTELIASFCLICGGAVFMESCDPVILGMEYRGIDSMFSLNLAVGFSALLMGWEMGVFHIKSWLRNRLH